MRPNIDNLYNEDEHLYNEVYNALCNLRLDFPSIFEGDLTEFGKWLNSQIEMKLEKSNGVKQTKNTIPGE